ncbi:Metallo-peptidase family M12-domain-containing protein [Halteromyces radiatus]|uniref:Metallo-peptidase family M12-domain-containing protein n=1 Tax=Halteromyces radiatus TaxID=101107 RepID=UPI00221EF963|nr:Metallo-peptidase family M12-domain-containing protein [Halteromyces radiatus]KAI8099578.1 Metallo-peptidase family M12-domain-containing protein [Halteromyces radiatus]
MVFKHNLCLILCIVILAFVQSIQGHSLNNRRLLRVEALTKVKLDIAPRPDSFFTKRSLTPNRQYQPRAQSIEHDDILRLAFQAYNQTHHLHLVPNQDLFHPEAVTVIDGKQTSLNHQEYRVYRGYVVDPKLSEQRWTEDQAGLWRDYAMEQDHGILGWARILVRHDIKHDLAYPVFEGAFMVNEDTYHVKASQNYQRVKRSDDADLHHGYDTKNDVHMVIYRDSDTVVVPVVKRDGSIDMGDSCGFDRLLYNNQHARYDTSSSLLSNLDYTNPFQQSQDIQRRHHYDKFIGIEHKAMMGALTKRAPSGCPTTKKINYMGAAADCTYTKYYQSDVQARMQIINDWNSASAVYERQLNIGLGLINITIMNSVCPTSVDSNNPWNRDCSDSYSISTRLSDFSQWRGNIADQAGLWHLMTNCPTGAELGVAWTKALCQTKATAQSSQTPGGGTEYVSGTGVSSVVRDEWKVVAHEVGHGFGAIHDCTAQNCPCSGSGCSCCPLSNTQCDAGGTYIMNPVNNASAGEFSPCTLNTICGLFPSIGSCLKDPGTLPTTGLKMCGNGIKEDGEDCDPNGQDTPCCDAKTCKFKPGAKCDDYNDLCCSNCQVRPANYTCRPATGGCDIAEVCDGTTGNCPADKFKDDGSDCGNGLQCASGQCTSRDAQCKSRGSAMNITRSCGGMTGGGSCQMSCADPHGFASCYIFTGYFLDGTPCGVGGACKQGSCSMENFGTNAKNWIDNHLQIVIPVAIVVGLLLLFCISRCIFSGTRGYRNINGDSYVVTTIPGQAPGIYAPQGYPPPGNGQYYAPPPPPPPNAPHGWVDPSLYNGPSPMAPPPSYTPNSGNRDVYEMNPTNQWTGQNNSTSPSPAPVTPHSPMINNSNNHGGTRRYNEGAV